MNVAELREVLEQVSPRTHVSVVFPGDPSTGIFTAFYNVENFDFENDALVLGITSDEPYTAGDILDAIFTAPFDAELIVFDPETADSPDDLWSIKDAYVEADGPLEHGDPIPDPIVIIVIED